MSGEEIAEQELMRLFEAARWAPSSFNAQQWRALYARRGTEYWPVFFELLVDGNKSWAKSAAVLVVFISRKTFDYNNEPSITHSYDTGARGRISRCKGFDWDSSSTAWKASIMNVRESNYKFPMNSRWKRWHRSASPGQRKCYRKNYRSVRVLTSGGGWRRVSAKGHFDVEFCIRANSGTDQSSRFSISRSIRGSGINQSNAAKTYSPAAIQELTNASGMAAR